MRLGLLVAGASAAVLTAAGVAGGALQDPKTLTLRASDLPAKARFVDQNSTNNARLPGGGTGRAYTAGYAFRNGTRDEEVVVTVVTTGTALLARGLFAAVRKEALSKTKADTTAIPRYGDQQLLATFYDGRGPNVWTEELIVRKGTVVWYLQIGAHPSSSKPFSRAQALAEVKKYAGKQKVRAGRG